MPTLGAEKANFLKQIQNTPQIDADTLARLVNHWDDLTVEDYRGYISEQLFEAVVDLLTDPGEKAEWNLLKSMPENDVVQLREKLQTVQSFMQAFPRGHFYKKAADLGFDIQKRIATIEGAMREAKEWDILDKGKYFALQTYLRRFPESVHKVELEDLMWGITISQIDKYSFERFLLDWPEGRYSEKARAALQELPEWKMVSDSDNIFLVNDYRNSHPYSLFKQEIDRLFSQLCYNLLTKMKAKPFDFNYDTVMKIIDANIFSKYQLIDEGVMTEKSWDVLRDYKVISDDLPDMNVFNKQVPNFSSAEDCTDVYFFGTPGTGKTCLLMGLVGANGSKLPDKDDASFSLNMKVLGGDYAVALLQYVIAGLTPKRTYGNFVTAITGHIDETDKRRNIVSHYINLIEMSGEEFAKKIANNETATLESMGTGVTKLMSNNNRKVFFIIVDGTTDTIRFQWKEDVKDQNGNVIGEQERTGNISQNAVLSQFVSLFELPDNKGIMDKVDAIHFIVTKADTLGNPAERLDAAVDLLKKKYEGPVTSIKSYCRKIKRINTINAKNDYAPMVFTFSLGKFYLGNIFSLDKTDTLSLVHAILQITQGKKERTLWDKIREALS